MKVTFYGSSDDNFCVRGDDNDEWGAYNRPRLVRTDTGLVIEGQYSPYEGKWRIRTVGIIPAKHAVKHVTAVNDDDDYTDELTITGPFKRIMPVLSREEIADKLDEYDWQNADDAVQDAVAKLLGWM